MTTFQVNDKRYLVNVSNSAAVLSRHSHANIVLSPILCLLYTMYYVDNTKL